MFSVVIPSYRRGDLLVHCVDSLISNRIKFKESQTIVVRNGRYPSVVDACVYLKNKYEDLVRIIELDENIGYGPGLNIGLHRATMPYTVFLNDDTKAVHGYDVTLFNELQEEGVGCVGVDGCQLKVVGQRYEHAGKDPDKPVDYIEGWMMAGPTSLFRKVGGMSEEYGLAFSEDADFSFKIVEAGYRLKVIPQIIDHIGHQTVSQNLGIDWNVLVEKNNKILFDKWHKRRQP